MDMSQGLPSSLSFALMKIQGVSVNSFEITPTSGSSTVTSNSQIRITLPTNCLMDFKTSRLYFSVEVSGTNSRLPAGIKSLFSRLTMSAGGSVIYQGSNFLNIQEYVRGFAENDGEEGINGHAEVVVSSSVQGSAIGATAAETYAAGLSAGNGTLFSIDLCELSKMSPRILDTSLLPNLELIFYTAGRSVVCAPKGNLPSGTGGNDMDIVNATSTANQDFAIVAPRFVVNAYSLLDGSYAMSLRQRMEDLGFLEAMFPQTLCFSQPFTGGNARFALSAACLDKITCIWRRSAKVNATGPCVPVAGYMTAKANGTKGPGVPSLGTSSVQTDGCGDAAYQGQYQHCSAPFSVPAFNANNAGGAMATAADFGVAGVTNAGGQFRCQYAINSARVPQFQADTTQWYDLSKWANNVVEHDDIKSKVEYLYNKFHTAYPFNLPQEPWGKPACTGIDTRSSNTFVEILGSGNVDQANYDVLAMAKISSILRIGSGKSLEIVQ